MESTPHVERGPAYRWAVLATLCLIYTFNFLDRQLMSILTEPIRKEMMLTDRQMGLLGGIYFAMFYTVIGVFVGFVADRVSRVRVLATGSFLWSMFTILCGMATGYPMLMTSRMGVGVGEAAGAPPSYSILSDYFPPAKRGMALGIFSLGVPFGVALGALLGGRIAEAYGWRTAFHVIGGAGLVATAFMFVFVKEPKRGAADANKVVAAPPSFLRTAADFFGRPTLLFTALSGGSVAFVLYGILNWTAPFLGRVKGINFREISTYYSLELAVCMGLGTWLSGQITDRLSQRARYWYAIVPMILVLVAIPFYIGFVWAPTWQLSLLFLTVPTLAGNAYLAPALAVVQNSVRPEQRTMSGALYLLVINLIGLGGGPTLVGELSTHFAATQGNVLGLKTALYCLTPFFGVAVLMHLCGAYFLRREDRAAR